MRSLFALPLLLLLGCASSEVRALSPVPDAATRYEVGDYVVYVYTGSFTEQPVALREDIRARQGNRLRIDVEAKRGDEGRRWSQLVTDTAENQTSNTIDAIYEWNGDVAVQLANHNEQDLFRLYEWTILVPEGPATEVSTIACDRELAGQRFDCTCTSGRNSWRGRPIRFESSSCPGFLWTNGSARFWDETRDETILEVKVTEFGRSGALPPAPLVPAGP